MIKGKVAFFLDNRKVADRMIINLESGNPGMGATEYLFFSLCVALTDRGNNVLMLLTKEQSIEYSIETQVVESIYAAIEFSKKNGVDVLIFRNNQEKLLYDRISLLTDIKFIVWAHNFNDIELEWITSCNPIKAYVCVSKAQMEELSRFEIYKKITYIYNFIWEDQIEVSSKYERSGGIVWQGSLTYEKSFHVLAKLWPDIKKKVPDAHLHVIGSGRLYDENESLGACGIASAEYENIFMKYLIDESTNTIDENVHFYGVIKDSGERKRIISNATVGVLNLTANSETLGMSGVEMQALGVPIVTINRLGCRETVVNGKTGYAVNSENEALNRIVELLQNSELNRQFGSNAPIFVKEKFGAEAIFCEWEILINGVICNRIDYKKKLGAKYRAIRLMKGNKIYRVLVRWYLNTIKKR